MFYNLKITCLHIICKYVYMSVVLHIFSMVSSELPASVIADINLTLIWGKFSVIIVSNMFSVYFPSDCLITHNITSFVVVSQS